MRSLSFGIFLARLGVMKNVPEWKDQEAQSIEADRSASQANSASSNCESWLNRDAPGVKREAAAAESMSASPADQSAD